MCGYSQGIYYEYEKEIKINSVILIDDFIVNFNFFNVVDDKIKKKYGGILIEIFLYVLLVVKFFVIIEYFKSC